MGETETNRETQRKRYTERKRQRYRDTQKQDTRRDRKRHTHREREFSTTEMKHLRQKQLKEREIHSDSVFQRFPDMVTWSHHFGPVERKAS